MKKATSINCWFETKPDSDNAEWPSPRSGHSCVTYKNDYLYLFGGMDENHTMNDMFEYNIPNNVKILFKKPLIILRNGERF